MTLHDRAPDSWRDDESRVRLRVIDDGRPITRGDCASVPRPCPHTKCFHHVGVNTRWGTPVEGSAAEDAPTCILDLADRGSMTLEEVGAVLGINRERVRQIEEKVLRQLRVRFPRYLRELCDGWSPTRERETEAGEVLSEIFDDDFVARVDAAYRRIVPPEFRPNQPRRAAKGAK